MLRYGGIGGGETREDIVRRKHLTLGHRLLCEGYEPMVEPLEVGLQQGGRAAGKRFTHQLPARL